MSTLNVMIQDAIEQSIENNYRVKVYMEQFSETSAVNVLHFVDDYQDHAIEDDGTWDVWGGEGASEWRLRLVFA